MADEKKIVVPAEVKDGSGEQAVPLTQDAIIAFLDEREKIYNDLESTRQEIEKEESIRRQLRADWKTKKARLNDSENERRAIMTMAGMVVDAEQENKNRYHYATRAFFYILGLADKTPDGKFKALYNNFNPIEKICQAVMDSTSFDGQHTIMIDTGKFLDVVKRMRLEQEAAKKAAAARLEDEWKKRTASSETIRSVNAKLENGKALAANLKKKGSGD